MTEVSIREERAATPEEGVASEPQCRHHWLIESPHGATSQGVCKLCGAIREFRNALDAYWEDDSVSDLGRWGRRSTPVRVTSDEDEMVAASGGEPALTV